MFHLFVYSQSTENIRCLNRAGFIGLCFAFIAEVLCLWLVFCVHRNICLCFCLTNLLCLCSLRVLNISSVRAVLATRITNWGGARTGHPGHRSRPRGGVFFIQDTGKSQGVLDMDFLTDFPGLLSASPECLHYSVKIQLPSKCRASAASSNIFFGFTKLSAAMQVLQRLIVELWLVIILKSELNIKY